MLTFTTLSLDASRIALDAVLASAQAADEPVAIAIAVVGRSGELRSFASMDGAFSLAGQIAQNKAYTVTIAGGAATKMLEEVIGTDPVFERLFKVDPRVMAVGGGVPIVVGGQFVGAIGVSGAPTAERDHELAQTGVDAVVEWSASEAQPTS